jgi:hypothetical protein
MKYVRIIGGAMKWTALAAWGWTVGCSHALAQAPAPGGTPTTSDSSSNYALPYVLVIMAIALGMLVVLRGSSRREREKPEEYQSKDMLSRD